VACITVEVSLLFPTNESRLPAQAKRTVGGFAAMDGLKAINGRYGHSEGDRALKKAADVLLNVFREMDLVARLGGDEFAVLALD